MPSTFSLEQKNYTYVPAKFGIAKFGKTKFGLGDYVYPALVLEDKTGNVLVWSQIIGTWADQKGTWANIKNVATLENKNSALSLILEIKN